MNEQDHAELRRGRADNPLVKVEDIAYVMFEKPDLDRTAQFLADFGLLPAVRTDDALYLRGRDGAHHCYVARRGAQAKFAGFALRAAARQDLDRLATAPGASAVEEVREPGGGSRVRLLAPNGVAVHVVHGMETVAPLPLRPALAMNAADNKVRYNATQRPPAGPAEVVRLGHCVMQTPHHSRMLLWLLRTFGLIVSDYQVLERYPQGGPAIAFIRCDRGATPADHHTIALGAGPADSFEHAAFEVQDLDAVGAGGAYLQARGWKHAWGIGRHILGSQIFDYWRDPDGMMVEHFADGDLFDAGVPTATSAFGRHSLAQWGPPLPGDFIDASLSPQKLMQLMSALRNSEDLSLRKLKAMKEALAR